MLRVAIPSHLELVLTMACVAASLEVMLLDGVFCIVSSTGHLCTSEKQHNLHRAFHLNIQKQQETVCKHH